MQMKWEKDRENLGVWQVGYGKMVGVYAQLNGVLNDENPSTWFMSFRWWWGILT